MVFELFLYYVTVQAKNKVWRNDLCESSVSNSLLSVKEAVFPFISWVTNYSLIVARNLSVNTVEALLATTLVSDEL